MKPRSRVEDPFEFKNTVRLKDRIFLSPVTKYLLPTFIIAMLLVAGIYIAMFFVNSDENKWSATCDIGSHYHVECLPGKVPTYEKCSEMGCCWSNTLPKCFHSLPSRHGYTQVNSNNYQALKPRRQFSPLGSENIPLILLEVARINSNHVKIALGTGTNNGEKLNNIHDKTQTEFYASVNNDSGNIKQIFNSSLDSKASSVELKPDPESDISMYLHNPEFAITVMRNNGSNKIPLLTTSRGPLIITENYWEWTISLEDSIVYGLNSLELNGTIQWIYDNTDGSKVPAYLGVSSDGYGVGCLLEYLGPLESQVLDGSNLIILRGMSFPDQITLHIFSGATPLNVINQMNKAMTMQSNIISITADIPQMPILGFHICPEYDSDPLKSVNSTTSIMAKHKAPWDTHCIHQQFYSTLDKPLNAKEHDISQEIQMLLKTEGRSIIPHVTPMISGEGKLLQRLSDLSLLLKQSKNISQFYVGTSGDENVIYPNWFDDKTLDEYKNSLADYLNEFDQPKFAFLQESWPNDETNYTSDFSKFDYIPEELAHLMSRGTIPYGLFSSTSTFHYIIHNGYAKRFQNFLQQSIQAPQISKQSRKIGWSSLRETLLRGIGSSLIGQLPPPIYVCGVYTATNSELCSRWYAVAVVFPQILAIPENSPGGAWLDAGTSKYASKLLRYRQKLLTYQRTIMAEYYSQGSPILAPTYIHYPLEHFMRHTWDQFMWGQSILVGIVTLPKTMQVHMKIPGTLPWRHLDGGHEVYPTGKDSISIVALEGEVITLLRPGHIVPVHEESMMTSNTKSPLKLVANLACEDDCSAEGKIGYEFDVFLNIRLNATQLTLKNIMSVKSQACSTSYSLPMLIKSVLILGSNIYPVNIDICTLDVDIFNFTLAVNESL